MSSCAKQLAHALFFAFLAGVMAAGSSGATETVTRIRFYVQDKTGGSNATVWKVAQCDLSNVLPSAFGLVLVTDTPITESHERDSQYLGQIQGLIAFTDMKQSAITLNVNVVFTEGKYKGSTLSLVGRNAIPEAVREVSVVAGTGAFRYARGHVIMRTHAVSADGNEAVYQYDATLLLPKIALQADEL